MSTNIEKEVALFTKNNEKSEIIVADMIHSNYKEESKTKDETSLFLGDKS